MTKQLAFASWMVPLLSGLAAACSSETGSPTTPKAPEFTMEQLQDPSTCNGCHQDTFKEWSGSMHAYASKDPVFLAMNERGQQETNGALGDFCVKCHAPMAVATGATKDGLNLDSVPENLQGITCYFCHNTKDVTMDVTAQHNNPLVLASDMTMRGPIKSPLEFGHAGEYSPLFDDLATQAGFRSSDLCGSCHDISVPAHFSGAAQDVALEQTFTEWKTSVFADPTSDNLRLNCASGGCHMEREERVPVASPMVPHPTMPTRAARHLHDFPAVDVALTDFPEMEAQAQAIKDKFALTMRVKICADRPGGVANTVYVQLESVVAGHYMPSGASQDRRMWAEVHAYRKGTEILSSGAVPQGKAATTVDGTWLFYDQALKADNMTPAHMFWDVASLKPNIIGVATTKNANANQVQHQFSQIALPDRVTVTFWVEPIGLDVIDDMIGSGKLDASIRSKIQRFAIQFPTVQADSLPDGTPVTFDWTPDAALAAADDPRTGSTEMGQPCLQFPPSVNITVTPPPAP